MRGVAVAPGIEVMTAVAGAGPRLLALPGTAADLRNERAFHRSALTQWFEVLTYDPRGLGTSDKPDVPYTMADYAADAIAVLDAYGWGRVHVLGNSFGGMTAQELAIRHPERIDRLVLASCTTGGEGGSSAELHMPHADAGQRRQLAARAAHDTYDRIDGVVARTLIIGGADDTQAPVPFQRTLADRLPNAELHLLAGGHSVLFENPDAQELVRTFLSAD